MRKIKMDHAQEPSRGRDHQGDETCQVITSVTSGENGFRVGYGLSHGHDYAHDSGSSFNKLFNM